MADSSTLRTISRNVASGWTAFAVQVAVVFFLTPFILSSLGPTRYGVWALITGLTGYYGLLDLGVRAGLTQYLTRYLSTRNFVKINSTASTGFVALVCCGCLVATATIMVAWLAPIVFQIPSDVVIETRLCILIIGISSAVNFGFIPFPAVFAATQRFDVSNAVVIGTALLSAGATYLVLRLGFGLVALSIISAATSLILYGTLWRLAYRVLPELIISPRLANTLDFWPILRYGGWSFSINGVNILKSQIDIILVGVFLPIDAIAPIALALSMVAYLDRLFIPIGSVLFPVVTDLDARGEASRLKSVYLTGSKIMVLLAIAIGVLSAAWAADFFRLWIHTDVTAGGTYPSPATLYCILVVAAASTASQRISQQICLGTRKMKSLVAILTCETAIKIGLSVVLVQRFGLIGIAVGTLLPAIVFQMLLLPANVNRILDINVRDYVRITCVRPLLTLIVMVCLLAPIMYVVAGVTSWTQLFLFAALTGVVACIPLLLIGLNRAERRRFVLEPALHFSRRVRWSIWSQRYRADQLPEPPTDSANRQLGTEIDHSSPKH